MRSLCGAAAATSMQRSGGDAEWERGVTSKASVRHVSSKLSGSHGLRVTVVFVLIAIHVGAQSRRMSVLSDVEVVLNSIREAF